MLLIKANINALNHICNSPTVYLKEVLCTCICDPSNPSNPRKIGLPQLHSLVCYGVANCRKKKRPVGLKLLLCTTHHSEALSWATFRALQQIISINMNPNVLTSPQCWLALNYHTYQGLLIMYPLELRMYDEFEQCYADGSILLAVFHITLAQ